MRVYLGYGLLRVCGVISYPELVTKGPSVGVEVDGVRHGSAVEAWPTTPDTRFPISVSGRSGEG